MLGEQALSYRQLASGTGDTPVAQFGTTAWAASTARALALRIATSGARC